MGDSEEVRPYVKFEMEPISLHPLGKEYLVPVLYYFNDDVCRGTYIYPTKELTSKLKKKNGTKDES